MSAAGPSKSANSAPPGGLGVHTNRGVFITGTDTGVGKTWVATALLRALVAAGFSAVGMKPVAAGFNADETVPEDVLRLASAGNVEAPVGERNPYAYRHALAPHVAAAAVDDTISLDRIAEAYTGLAGISDAVIVEGAGGVLVPIGPRHDMLDIAVRLRLPVLLVVGIRLGCINHALLSVNAIRARGLNLIGWIANRIEPAMAEPNASIAAIADRLNAPMLEDLHWRDDAPHLDRTLQATLDLPSSHAWVR